MATERIFITGGTGNVGTRVVNDLLGKKIPVTLFTRSPDKIRDIFPNHGGLIQVIQGSFDDISPLQEGLHGHTRLFLLISDLSRLAELKDRIARFAYEAGIKQIVDISSNTIENGWRLSSFGEAHRRGEKEILKIQHRGNFVALRPNRFFSNHLTGTSSLQDNVLYDSVDPDYPQGWVSPNDVGAFAATILQDNIEKHGDKVYNLTGQLLTGNQRAEVLSRVTGNKVNYIQDAWKRYEFILKDTKYPHVLAIDFIDTANGQPEVPLNPSIEIILRRKPETFEEYLKTQKSRLK